MRLDLHLTDGRKLAVHVKDESALYELLNGEGGYKTGWAQTSTGEWVRLSQVVSVRALDRP